MTNLIGTLFDRQAVSRTDKAYVMLEELIVTGELAPGSQWSETSLGERIDIGRSPVRDALQKLAFQRLVYIAPRQGIFISEIDYQGQLKVIQARRQIEPLIVEQAAVLATEDERHTMRLLLNELQKLKLSHNMRGYMRLHFALTDALGAASRNSYLAEFYAILQTLSRRFLYFHKKRHADLTFICELHINQLQAIIDGTPELAQKSAQARNDYAENLARETILEMIVNSELQITPSKRKSTYSH